MPDSTIDALWRLGVGLMLGLLVGLQREVLEEKFFAGIRTFALIGVFGTMCGLLVEFFGGWTVAAGFGAIIALVCIGHISEQNCAATKKIKSGSEPAETGEEKPRLGITTEIAALLVYAIGAYLAKGSPAVGVAVGGSVAILLHWKEEIHGIVEQLGANDVRAILQFVLITFIILPVLPNQSYGPYGVFNPREIWMLVSLIVGISLSGYLVYKFLGAKLGILFGGLIGGTISSTATTVTYARRTREAPGADHMAAIVVVIASGVVFARLLVEISVVAPSFVREAAIPIGLVGAFAFILGAVLFGISWRKNEMGAMPQQENPTQLKSALWFAAMYAFILLTVEATRNYLGNEWLTLAAILSGLADMDAITLSLSRMVQNEELEPGRGWRLILTAGISNLAFKGVMAAWLGSRSFGWRIILLFGLIAAFAGAVILFWK